LAALGGVLRARAGGYDGRNGDFRFALLDVLEVGNGA
jgi:formylmethanofuran:tetrahydromethanopterin formyltransferase